MVFLYLVFYLLLSGIDFKIKNIMINGDQVKLQIWSVQNSSYDYFMNHFFCNIWIVSVDSIFTLMVDFCNFISLF